MKKMMIVFSLFALSLLMVACTPAEPGDEAALAGEAVKIKTGQKSSAV